MNGALIIDTEKNAVIDRIALQEPKGFPKEGMVAHGLRVTPNGSELWLTTQMDDQIRIFVEPSCYTPRGQVDRFSKTILTHKNIFM